MSALNFRTLDLQPTAQTVKDSPGQVIGYSITNQHATDFRYVKGYNKTGATSSDTPLFTWCIPPKSTGHRALPNGIQFAALSVRGTTGVADNNTGAPTANDLVVNIEYI